MSYSRLKKRQHIKIFMKSGYEYGTNKKIVKADRQSWWKK